jgi:hypothetical protein
MGERPQPFDVVRLKRPVGLWPAGTEGAVVDAYETYATVEVGTDQDEIDFLDCLLDVAYEDLELVWLDPSGRPHDIRESLGTILRRWRGLGVVSGPGGVLAFLRDILAGIFTCTLRDRMYVWAASVRAWSEPDFRAEVKMLRERATTPAEDLISIEELARQVLGDERARQIFGEDPEWTAVKNDPRFRDSLEQMRRGERGQWPEHWGFDEGTEDR